MMFMIGRGERIQALGPPVVEHCPKCGEERDFLPQLHYSYGQFDLVFGFVYERRYLVACPTCNHGWLLDRQTAEQTYGRPAIPFHLRYGWLVLAGLVALGSAAYLYRQAA